MKKILNEGNQIHNFISSSGSGTVINYGSGYDFLTSYGSGSTRQIVKVPVPQHCRLKWYHCLVETVDFVCQNFIVFQNFFETRFQYVVLWNRNRNRRNRKFFTS
jgi:hypothetical protein